MDTHTKYRLLAVIAVQLSARPGFMAYELRWRSVTPRHLGLDGTSFARLCICRAPRAGRRAQDLGLIATRVGVDRDRLAAALQSR